MINRPFRFGVVAAWARSGADWLETARRIEQHGYATLLTPDRIGPLLSPMPALAAAATATTTLGLGTYVLNAGLRNPTVLARECATLDLLSNGRFELGFGTGAYDGDFRVAGLPVEKPGERVERLAAAIRTIKTRTSTPATAFPGQPTPPVPRRLPILIAGSGKRMLSLAAKEADAVALAVGPRADEATLREKIDWLRQEAGARADEIELNANLVAVVREGQVGPGVRERLRALFGIDLDDLIQARSPLVLTGDVDHMCEQVQQLRERLGISYLCVAYDSIEAFAPVVERLAGK